MGLVTGPLRTCWQAVPLACVLSISCAATRPGQAQGPRQESTSGAHGTISNLSVAPPGAAFCEHRVPAESCVRCHPDLAEKFQAVGDWCVEHGVPESQCLTCHPDLTFTPGPEPPPGADIQRLSERGEDVPALGPHAVLGKVTLFDFYADWCVPCRKVDEYVYELLRRRSDIAVRKLNIVSWDTPVARHHLAKAATLPYLMVYGRDGKRVGAMSGLDLPALDRLIAAGAGR
jgi:thiol-disulfide isomerase/thioredoxin